MKHLTCIVKLLSRKIYLNFCGGKELSPALTGFIGEVIDKTAGIFYCLKGEKKNLIFLNLNKILFNMQIKRVSR